MNTKQKLDKEISAVIKKSEEGMNHRSTGKLTYKGFLADPMLMRAAIRSGVPYSLFDSIKETAPFSENDWAVFLGISTKSLLRCKQERKLFKPIQSEKIIEMAEVTNIGLETFDDVEKFKLWLGTPNFSLGNLKPIELLTDSYGKELVVAELTRINHGILV